MKLFVSYRRTNWPFAHHMAEKLRQLMHCDIFIDYQGIDDPNFERSISRHLMESNAILVVVSQDTFSERIWLEEDWVRHEIRMALQQNKPIVPVCVDGVLPPANLPSDIREVHQKQCIMFYPDYYDAALQRLADFISRAVPDYPTWTEATRLSRPERERRSNHNLIANENTLNDAVQSLRSGDFEKAAFLLETLRDASYTPKTRSISLDALLKDAYEGLNQARLSREARNVYGTVVAMAGSGAQLSQARIAWRDFRRQYPDYKEDPENLSERLKTPTPVDRMVSMVDSVYPQRDQSTAVRRPSPIPMLDWVTIPASSVYINGQNYAVGAFAIARYPVTNEQFGIFARAGDGYMDPRWWDFSHDAREWRHTHNTPRPGAFGGALHPREMVTWFEAIAFSRWLAARTGLPITLPTEIQWQRAAQGDDGRLYPWGNTFDMTRCNTYESGLDKTTPVTRYHTGASPFGVCDMVGNVLEWCLNLYDYPHDSRLESLGTRALRGGSWAYYALNARISTRYFDFPQACYNGVGFRLALAHL